MPKRSRDSEGEESESKRGRDSEDKGSEPVGIVNDLHDTDGTKYKTRCYMITALQSLYAATKFRKYVLDDISYFRTEVGLIPPIPRTIYDIFHEIDEARKAFTPLTRLKFSEDFNFLCDKGIGEKKKPNAPGPTYPEGDPEEFITKLLWRIQDQMHQFWRTHLEATGRLPSTYFDTDKKTKEKKLKPLEERNKIRDRVRKIYDDYVSKYPFESSFEDEHIREWKRKRSEALDPRVLDLFGTYYTVQKRYQCGEILSEKQEDTTIDRNFVLMLNLNILMANPDLSPSMDPRVRRKVTKRAEKAGYPEGEVKLSSLLNYFFHRPNSEAFMNETPTIKPHKCDIIPDHNPSQAKNLVMERDYDLWQTVEHREIYILPPIFMIGIVTRTNDLHTEKYDTFVTANEHIILKSRPKNQGENQNQNSKEFPDGYHYNLVAIIQHRSLKTAASGHYICYVKRGKRWWYLSDDEDRILQDHYSIKFCRNARMFVYQIDEEKHADFNAARPASEAYFRESKEDQNK